MLTYIHVIGLNRVLLGVAADKLEHDPTSAPLCCFAEGLSGVVTWTQSFKLMYWPSVFSHTSWWNCLNMTLKREEKEKCLNMWALKERSTTGERKVKRHMRTWNLILNSSLYSVFAGHWWSGAAVVDSAHSPGVYGPEARSCHQTVSPDRACQGCLLQTVRQLIEKQQRQDSHWTSKQSRGMLWFCMTGKCWISCLLVENFWLLAMWSCCRFPTYFQSCCIGKAQTKW